MKKGQLIALETIVKFLPHIIVLVIVIAVFVMFVNVFLAKDITPEMKDFERVLSEMDYIMKQPNSGETQTIAVPVQEKSNLDMRFLGPGNIVSECNKKACLCLNSDKGAFCKVYPDFTGECTSNCKNVCSIDVAPIRNEKTKITITRTCGTIRIK